MDINDKWNELERVLVDNGDTENRINMLKSVFYGGVVGLCALLEKADSKEATAKVFDDTQDAIGKYYFERGQAVTDRDG